MAARTWSFWGSYHSLVLQLRVHSNRRVLSITLPLLYLSILPCHACFRQSMAKERCVTTSWKESTKINPRELRGRFRKSFKRVCVWCTYYKPNRFKKPIAWGSLYTHINFLEYWALLSIAVMIGLFRGRLFSNLLRNFKEGGPVCMACACAEAFSVPV